MVKDMWRIINKLLDRVESRIALWTILQGGGVVTFGAITAWLSTGVDWINQYGAFGWWVAGLLGALVALLLLLGVAWLRYAWIRGGAIREWKRRADTVNPLDNEFHKVRIKLSDFENPYRPIVKGKRFTGCELIGPANMTLKHTGIHESGFSRCDLVAIQPAKPSNTITLFENCHFINCVFYGVTIFVNAESMHEIQHISGDYPWLNVPPATTTASPVESPSPPSPLSTGARTTP